MRYAYMPCKADNESQRVAEALRTWIDYYVCVLLLANYQVDIKTNSRGYASTNLCEIAFSSESACVSGKLSKGDELSGEVPGQDPPSCRSSFATWLSYASSLVWRRHLSLVGVA